MVSRVASKSVITDVSVTKEDIYNNVHELSEREKKGKMKGCGLQCITLLFQIMAAGTSKSRTIYTCTLSTPRFLLQQDLAKALHDKAVLHHFGDSLSQSMEVFILKGSFHSMSSFGALGHVRKSCIFQKATEPDKTHLSPIWLTAMKGASVVLHCGLVCPIMYHALI